MCEQVAAPSVGSMASVELSTYLSPYKPIPSAVPGWDDARQATWPATTSSLLSVGGKAVLVDALMTVAEGAALAEWVAVNGVSLSSVYVTHAHADHFFGATSLPDHLPEARLVTLPDIVVAAELARRRMTGQTMSTPPSVLTRAYG
jgi:glyoxylase-like metal-dependent hydrolase (beta-lactamase superfamily II)